MNKKRNNWITAGIIVVLIVIMGGCSYNGMMTADENVKKAWGEVENQYQRRADLIPNLVATVQEYAKHESSTLEAVTNARVGLMAAKDSADAYLNRPVPETQAQFAAANAAQDKLQRNLGIYVNAVHEAYPDLKANTNFEKLQDELAGTESRVSKARKDFVEAVNGYNVKVRRFPANLLAGIFGFSPRDQFSAEAGAEKAPDVKNIFND